MEFDKAKFMEKLKELVAYGKKKKSVLEYQEINDFFRDMPLDAEQMEKVFEYLEASGIDVLRLSDMTEDPNAADRDLLLLDDDDIDLSEEEEIDMENIDLSVPEGVSIGALSFVPSNYKFEPWTVYAGRPIRPIKKRNKENVLNTLRKIGYVK